MRQHLGKLVAGTALLVMVSTGQMVRAQEQSLPDAVRVLRFDAVEASKTLEEAARALPGEAVEAARNPNKQSPGEVATEANRLVETLKQRTQQELEKPDSAAVGIANRAGTVAKDATEAAMLAQRGRVERFLGIEAQKQGGLYYFVSWSMPETMLKNLVSEARWTGGTVVFRGIPKNVRTLSEFLTEKLIPLMGGLQAGGAFMLDPRMFEAYEVDRVPAIVYSENPDHALCASNVSNPVHSVTLRNKDKTQKLSYSGCGKVPSDKYWKLYGAVTSDFALREIIKNGGKGAKVYHDALAKGGGVSSSGTPAKELSRPLEGIPPGEALMIESAIDAYKRLQGLGAEELIKSKHPSPLTGDGL